MLGKVERCSAPFMGKRSGYNACEGRLYFSHWTGDRDVLADIRDAWPSFEIPATKTSTSRFYRVRVELSE